jgi:multisubunit Na+/H+ antiporter MnhG subunit
VVGQLVLFAPLLALPGAGIVTANAASAVVAAIGLMAARDQYRRTQVPARATLAGLVTALFPGFLLRAAAPQSALTHTT